MASWKKVIVSGSNANLTELSVDNLTSGQVVIGGGTGNLSTTAINGTGTIVATTGASGLSHSGSFSGSFQGTISGGNAFVQDGNSFGTTALLGTNDTQNLQFETNGSVRMTISSSGNVGIGITIPTASLHVRTTAVPSAGETIAQFDVSDDSSYLKISNNTVANNTFIPSLESYNSSNKTALYTLGNGATDTGAEPLLTFDARIGTAQVATRPLFQWSNYGDVKMTMRANGNLGIGTTTPNAKLNIWGGTLGTSSGDYLASQTIQSLVGPTNGETVEFGSIRTSNGNDWTTSGFRIQERMDNAWQAFMQFNGDGNNNGISFGTGNSTGSRQSVPTRMTITSEGNVGIGNTNPNVALDVTGEIAIRGAEDADDARMYFRAADNSNRFTIETDIDVNNSLDKLGFRSTFVDNILVLGGDGNVAIGSTGSYKPYSHNGDLTTIPKLDVFGSGSIPLTIRTTNLNSDHVLFTSMDTNTKWWIALSGNDFRIYNTASAENILLGVDGSSFDTGNKVGIGIALPSQKLDVSGSVNIIESASYKQDGNNVIYIAKGTDAFYANTIGGAAAGTPGLTRQTVYGHNAGALSSGSEQTTFGFGAGYNNTGSWQVAVGYQAGLGNSGSSQTTVGYRAGLYNTASAQTALGESAGQWNAGISQTAVGAGAGIFNSGSYQTAIGVIAGWGNLGNNQTAVGAWAGYLNSGSDNTNIGYIAGRYTTGTTENTQSTQSVFLGSSTKAGGPARTNQIVIGYNASGIGSNSVVLGNDSILTTALKGNVGIGITTPSASLHVNNIVSGLNSFLVEDSTNPDNTPFVIDANGNVGIGISTTSGAWVGTASLHIVTSGSNSDRGSSVALRLRESASNAQFNLSPFSSSAAGKSLALNDDTTGAALQVWTENGNVGIGKETANAKLDVSGNTIITGSLTVTGGITGSITASGVYGPYGANSVISSSYAVNAGKVNNALTAGKGITYFSYDGSSPVSIQITGSNTLTTNVITKWTGTAFADTSLIDNYTTVTGASSIQLTGASSSLTGSFTGSFKGDGSGLTGLASTLNVSASLNALSPFLTSGSVSLTSQGLTIQGTINEIEAVIVDQTVTIGLPNDVAILNQLTVGGDLIVNGTTTTVNTTDLLIEDKFILLASGSANSVDSGIIIDRGAYSNQNVAFGYDADTVRWGLQSNVTDSTSTMAIGTNGDSAFVGTVFTEAAHTSTKPTTGEFVVAGAIYTNTDGTIWMYA